jgi:hypothetical protein
MKRAVIVVGVLAVGFVLLRLMTSPSAPDPAGASGSAGGQTIVGTGLAAGAAVRADAWKQYFQRMLIQIGDDSSRQFAADLAELGLTGPQLQALPIDQAYTLAHDAAAKIEDTATRRRYLLELFNETER